MGFLYRGANSRPIEMGLGAARDVPLAKQAIPHHPSMVFNTIKNVKITMRAL